MIEFHPGHLDAGQHCGDAGVGQDGVEQGRILAVAVPHDVPESAFGVFEVHGEVAGGLDDPGGGRMRRGAENADAAGGVFDDGQHVQTRAGHG
jgi:hypothetical protein